MGFDAVRPPPQIHTNTHMHASTPTHMHSEFGFHILSTGCVMTPVIKAGNCLTVVLRYWIRGQFCRHNRRQLDVKSLSGEIGSRAEQTHRRWYQHQREMLALCCLTLVNGSPVTLSPPETLTDSVPLPPENQTLCVLENLIKTPHGAIQPSKTSDTERHKYTVHQSKLFHVITEQFLSLKLMTEILRPFRLSETSEDE